jgi:hypothetical protein
MPKRWYFVPIAISFYVNPRVDVRDWRKDAVIERKWIKKKQKRKLNKRKENSKMHNLAPPRSTTRKRIQSFGGLARGIFGNDLTKFISVGLK